ncbi:MAG TPA: sigma-70 family RNA polymerase sigma factor [Steroidobacteraceae bacterium]
MSSRSGFDALVAEHQPMVARICASYERDRDLARELSQDVWFAIWRALPGFRGDASLKTFVARIAQFRAISHVTQRAREPLQADLSEDIADLRPAPETAAIASSERIGLLAAVQRLPLVYRQPVILTLEDFSPAEIAAMLGLSVNVVGVRHTRARSMLRSLLGAL